MSRFFGVVLAVLWGSFIVLGVQGCTGKDRFTETVSLEQFQQYHETDTVPAHLSSIESDSKGSLALMDAMNEEDYRLGPGDLLSIKVLEAEELNAEVRVSSQGKINVPLLGEVSVLNMTVAETEHRIEGLYQKDYIYDPHVAVYIKEHVSNQITIVGAVKQPGTYEYLARKRLLDVIAIGRGLTEKAGGFAHITRKIVESSKTFTYIVDLDELVKNGNMALNHVIQGGDVVFIPEAGQCFVDGAVRKPGTYPLTGAMSITEAIAQAGGLSGYADEDKIRLIRYMGRGKQRQIVNISYDDLQSGIGDTVLLKDQDIIFAESSSSGKLLSGSGFTLGFMGTGMSFRNPDGTR